MSDELILCFGGSLDGKMARYKGGAMRSVKLPARRAGAWVGLGVFDEIPYSVSIEYETYIEDRISFGEAGKVASLNFYRLESLRNIDVFKMLIDRYSGGGATLKQLNEPNYLTP